MDVREQLQQLPEPDREALDRVWRRYRASRSEAHAGRAGWAWWGAGATVALATAVVGLVLVTTSDPPRREVLESGGAVAVTDWTDEVQLTVDGRGEIAGTGKNAEIRWQSGTITASVAPASGNTLKVVTEEAVVEVVGTVFSVTRNPLGVSTTVEKGRVRVTCTTGWTGQIGPEDGAKVCLPVRPAALQGRFAKLRESGASLEVQLETLDAGLAVAEPGSEAEGQLLLGRMEVHRDQGALDALLADADRYFARPRSQEVRARQLVSQELVKRQDCTRALPHLAALEHPGTPVDRVLLASCLRTDQPKRAATLLDDALPHLDPAWQKRAQLLRESLP
jgi:hypothetical protein